MNDNSFGSMLKFFGIIAILVYFFNPLSETKKDTKEKVSQTQETTQQNKVELDDKFSLYSMFSNNNMNKQDRNKELVSFYKQVFKNSLTDKEIKETLSECLKNEECKDVSITELLVKNKEKQDKMKVDIKALLSKYSFGVDKIEITEYNNKYYLIMFSSDKNTTGK